MEWKNKCFLLAVFLILFALVQSSFAQEDFFASSNKDVLTSCGCSITDNIITIKNTGAIKSDYLVSVKGNAAEWSRAVPNVISLKPGEEINVHIFINVPCDITGEYGLDVGIKTSLGLEKKIKQIVSVGKCKNIQLTSKDVSKISCPCKLSVYELNIKNVDSYDETYDITVSKPFRDWGILSANKLIINSGETATVFFYLNPPCDIYGKHEAELKVSAKNSDYDAKIPLKVNILPCYDFNLTIGEYYAKDGKIYFRQHTGGYDFCDGEIGIIPVMISNNVDIPNKYDIETKSELVLFDKESISLKGKEKSIFNIFLNAPKSAKGSFVVPVDVLTEKGNLKLTSNINVNVDSCYTPQIIADKKIRSNYSEKIIPITVTNNGIKKANYRFDIKAPEWARIDKLNATLKPKESAVINVYSVPTDKTEKGSYDMSLITTVLENNVQYTEKFEIELTKPGIANKIFNAAKGLLSDLLNLYKKYAWYFIISTGVVIVLCLLIALIVLVDRKEKERRTEIIDNIRIQANRINSVRVTKERPDVREVIINPAENMEGISIKVVSPCRIPKIKPDAALVYDYFEIEPTNITEKEIKKALIVFRVKREWTNKNLVPENKIRLMRFEADGWKELETRKINADFDYTYYEARTPMFSVFAIVAKEKGVKAAEKIEEGKVEEKKFIEEEKKTRWPLYLGIIILILVLAGLGFFAYKYGYIDKIFARNATAENITAVPVNIIPQNITNITGLNITEKQPVNFSRYKEIIGAKATWTKNKLYEIWLSSVGFVKIYKYYIITGLAVLIILIIFIVLSERIKRKLKERRALRKEREMIEREEERARRKEERERLRAERERIRAEMREKAGKRKERKWPKVLFITIIILIIIGAAGYAGYYYYKNVYLKQKEIEKEIPGEEKLPEIEKEEKISFLDYLNNLKSSIQGIFARNATAEEKPAVLENVSEEIIMMENETGIPAQKWAKNTAHEIKLSDYFYDYDNDQLYYSSTYVSNIDITIDDDTGIAKLTPEKNWYGTAYVIFTADDRKGGVVASNKVRLIVEDITAPGEGKLDKFKDSVSNLYNSAKIYSVLYWPYIAAGVVVLAILILAVSFNKRVVDFLAGVEKEERRKKRKR